MSLNRRQLRRGVGQGGFAIGQPISATSLMFDLRVGQRRAAANGIAAANAIQLYLYCQSALA
jgi:hypothetical protein